MSYGNVILVGETKKNSDTQTPSHTQEAESISDPALLLTLDFLD